MPAPKKKEFSSVDTAIKECDQQLDNLIQGLKNHFNKLPKAKDVKDGPGKQKLSLSIHWRVG